MKGVTKKTLVTGFHVAKETLNIYNNPLSLGELAINVLSRSKRFKSYPRDVAYYMQLDNNFSDGISNYYR